MTDIQKEDGTTLSDQSVSLPYPPVQVIEAEHLRIIRVEPEAGDCLNRNVYGVDPCGNIVWQIQESPHGTQGDKPYMSISLNRRGDLIAGNWNGIDYFVSLTDGTIEPRKFLR